MNQLTFNLQPERRIYTVSDLTARNPRVAGEEFHGCHRAGGDFELPPGFVWSLLLYFEG